MVYGKKRYKFQVSLYKDSKLTLQMQIINSKDVIYSFNNHKSFTVKNTISIS